MMPDLDLSWLDALPDMRISGVQRVQGVQRQKTAPLECTPQGVHGCACTPAEAPAHLVHTGAHVLHTSRTPQEMVENCGSTPCTPCTPNFDVETDASAVVGAGLEHLRHRRAPASVAVGQWMIIVGDALRLRDDGWVGKALGFGWSVSDLFDVRGLAVWLDGRRVSLLDADGANAGPWCRGFMGPDAGRYRRQRRAVADKYVWDA
jgi:hypothetical protein